jgi:hypothetical protein
MQGCSARCGSSHCCAASQIRPHHPSGSPPHRPLLLNPPLLNPLLRLEWLGTHQLQILGANGGPRLLLLLRCCRQQQLRRRLLLLSASHLRRRECCRCCLGRSGRHRKSCHGQQAASMSQCTTEVAHTGTHGCCCKHLCQLHLMGCMRIGVPCSSSCKCIRIRVLRQTQD